MTYRKDCIYSNSYFPAVLNDRGHLRLGLIRPLPIAGRLFGTAALKIASVHEREELESASILTTFGQVPDDFAEQLTGG